MNSSDFRERLGAEPRKTAAELAEEIAADPRLSAAKDAALAFEGSLEQTLRAPEPGDDLLDGILAVPSRRFSPAWLAVAASLLLAVGLSSVFLWRGPAGMPVEEYVRTHYEHDGLSVLAMAGDSHTPADVTAVFASLGVQASPQLAKGIVYIKFCPTPEGKGAHMIVNTADGPATVIFMPSVQLDEPLLLSLDHTQARVIGLETGAAAIIGADDSATRQLEASLRAGLTPMSVDA